MNRDEIKSLQAMIEYVRHDEEAHFVSRFGDDSREHIFEHLTVLQDYVTTHSNHSQIKETN